LALKTSTQAGWAGASSFVSGSEVSIKEACGQAGDLLFSTQAVLKSFGRVGCQPRYNQSIQFILFQAKVSTT